MKKILLLAMICVSIAASAQWQRTVPPNVVLQTTTDKVGIGLSTPKSTLDVLTPMPVQGSYTSQYWSTDNPSNNLKIQHTWSNDFGTTHEFIQKASGTDYPVLNFYDGKVGIGLTRGASAKFEVNYELPSQGTYSIQKWSVGNQAYHLRLEGVWDGGGISERMVQRFNNTDYSMLTFFQGNIGIGIDNPQSIDARLAVKGTVHAREVLVDVTGAVGPPDYVFADTYKLPSLAEIERYIKANKHLPEVPSAATMEEKGINVGEMNLILLKKIEELTLHMIQQEKTLADQNQQIQALKKQIENK